jgi:methionyl-tRNA synthetase
VSWGVPVPGDDTQVMYVWCDALSNYITAIGYGTDSFDDERWNNATHVIGKDILRFHAAIWPGMLLSAGLALPKNILVHGHITSGGQKMSKSLGNVIDPNEILMLFKESAGELAGEAVRFVLLHEIPSFEDGDMTMETIKASYSAHLANGIGNLTNRIMKMATSYGVVKESIDLSILEQAWFTDDMDKGLTQFALRNIMSRTKMMDNYIQIHEPFKLIKTNEEEAKKHVEYLLRALYDVALVMQFFMPQTSAKILECIRENKMPEKPLFNRLP